MFYSFENPMETEIQKLLEKEGYGVDVYIQIKMIHLIIINMKYKLVH